MLLAIVIIIPLIWGLVRLKKIHKINVVNSPLVKLSLDTILKMDEYFKEDINLLSRLLNRDLSHWRISK